MNTLQREIKIHLKNKTECFETFILFLLLCSLFPIVLEPSGEAMRWAAPAIIWIVASIAIMIFFEGNFRVDAERGVFQQIVLSGVYLPLHFFQKLAAIWLVTGVPISILSLFLGIAYGLDFKVRILLGGSLLIGSIALTFITGLCSGLTISLPRSGALLALLAFPLYLPILVLGVMVTSIVSQEFDYSGHLALLLSLSILVVIGVPFALAVCIKVGES